MTFDDLWAAGLANARARLAGKPAVAALADRLARPSFPAAVALLVDPRNATATKGPDFLRDVATTGAGTPEAQAKGLDAAAIEDILRALFVRRAIPSATGQPNELVELAIRKALERQGLAVTDGELHEIVHLLETGQFYQDLVGTAGAIFSTIPSLPIALLKDIPKLPALPAAGVGGLFGDLFDLVGSLPQVAGDLRDGRIDQPPAVATRLLALLYGLGTVARVRDLLARVLAPENRSVRLALLLYARSNGFDIEERQLDVVYQQLLAKDSPDLGPVLAEALEFLKARYGGAELEQVLGALQRGGMPT